jgi:DNA polymerase II large subunit
MQGKGKRFVVDNQEYDDKRIHWVAGYDDVLAAEKAARKHTMLYDRSCTIQDTQVVVQNYSAKKRKVVKEVTSNVIAVTVKDALDRVWTEVQASPGQTTLL